MKIDIKKLHWKKVNNLIPAIIQNDKTGQVLMLGYMNKKALEETISTGKVTFFSRTKKRLWQKGEESENILNLTGIKTDCDNDALLISVNPVGKTCHLDKISCFGENKVSSFGWLAYLEDIVTDRYNNRRDNSYISQLFNEGSKRIAQKVGEEGVELAIAATSDDDNLANEAADLLFHLIILLKEKGIKLQDIIDILEKRNK